MLDQLKNKYHCVFMDNLYMSALFARRVMGSDNCVKIHGVTRREGKGIPSCVRQYDVQDENALDSVRNTLKVAVLEGDKIVKDLVAISYYDSKPVYFLSTVVSEVKWDTCGKKIFSKTLKQKVIKKFLRPNFVNCYNYDMNSVDRADHLRKNYELGMFLRQRKWWWSVFMWGLDVAIVNSYILYKTYHQMHNLEYISHYRFREQLFLAWMDSDQYWPTRYSTRKRFKKASASVEGSAMKRGKQESSASLSSLSTRMTRSSTSSLVPNSGGKKHCTTLTLGNLESGLFGKRLILNEVCTHFPLPVRSKHSECQLHKMFNKRTRKQVMLCPDCNLTLCILCFKPFHTVDDLNKIKVDVQNDFCLPSSSSSFSLSSINISRTS